MTYAGVGPSAYESVEWRDKRGLEGQRTFTVQARKFCWNNAVPANEVRIAESNAILHETACH